MGKKAIVAAFLFLLAVIPVRAEVFIPSSALFGTDADGAWEFAEPENKTIPAKNDTWHQLFSTDFLHGLPEGVQVEGAHEFIADFDGVLLRLNSMETPHYLVENSFSWTFVIPELQDVWLAMEYRLWSSETERGFDEPVAAFYVDDTLFHKEDITQFCPAESREEEGTCQWNIAHFYIGRLEGEHTVSVFAGDTGDLQKPSGIDIWMMKINAQALEADENEYQELEDEENPTLSSPQHITYSYSQETTYEAPENPQTVLEKNEPTVIVVPPTAGASVPVTPIQASNAQEEVAVSPSPAAEPAESDEPDQTVETTPAVEEKRAWWSWASIVLLAGAGTTWLIVRRRRRSA